MALHLINVDAVADDLIILVSLRSKTTNQLVSGVAYTAITYDMVRNGDATGTVGAAAVTMTAGTYASAGWVETNNPGVYQFGVPSAAVASGQREASITIHDAGGTTLDAVEPIGIITPPDNAGITAIKTKTDLLPSATAGTANGLLIAGTNAATTFSSATGPALTITSTGANGTALSITGNGTGAGASVTGGATGAGIEITSGATSGNGIDVRANLGIGIYVDASDATSSIAADLGTVVGQTSDAQFESMVRSAMTAAGATSTRLAKLDSIGVATVTITSPVASDGTTIQLIRGDDYYITDGRQIGFTVTGPSITGATVTLVLTSQTTGATVTITGTVTSATACRFEITRTVTAALERGAGAYHYDLRAALATSADVVTLAEGSVDVDD